MGSLNGDVVVMRNGRSTSQVSIYNYPEHLNPFYEEDQHKRLRFWKISKKDNEGRRNSFSIGNLKDMWAFKSFRTKKKSSTLGISKTSESPPPMRREYVVDNGWNSFDHRLRDSDSFQRNAGYRSSLQNLPSNSDRIGFNRNDDYRSTIQVPRPNPRHQQQKPQPQPRRSSQSSMVSTNPFESDIEDDNEDVSAMTSLNGGSTTTLSKATARKKRRAPAPPTPIHGRSDRAVTPAIVIESSQDVTPNDLCIREDTDIANLTAEIESFVKDKNNEDIETIVIAESHTAKVAPDTKTSKDVVVQENINTTTTITTTTTAPAPAPAPTTGSNNVAVVRENEVTQAEVTTVTPPVVEGKERTQVHVATTHSPKQGQSQTNGQIKTEIITVKTTTTSTVAEPPKPANGRVVSATSVSQKSEPVTKMEDRKEAKSNGAIPKKPHNAPTRVNNVELSIEESSERQQSPTPVPRVPKSETEVGNVECIHVHVESPRATPREDHSNRVTSFKNEQNAETAEVITTKTPFVLTSPPRQRKSAQQTVLTKEHTQIVQSPRATASNELNIREENVQAKPEIMTKPALSPKPIMDRNGKVHTFAEIHKPRGNKVTHATANGHVTRTSRDEVVAPPTIPQQQTQTLERQVTEKIVAVTSAPNTEVPQKRNTEDQVTEVATPTLKIEETPPAATHTRTRDMHSATSHSPPPSAAALVIETSTVDTPGTSDNVQFDSLYRPHSHMEWKRSTLAPLERNIPPEKRKSVKDIIESINRSQRLLHASANKDFTIVTGPPSPTPSPNPDNSDDNLRILDESQREIRRMVQQIDHLDNSGEATASNGTISLSSSPPPSYNECVAAQKLDNNEIFQKCVVKKEVYDYRESSPITSNLDWNPVPKPKRTKPQNE